MRTNFNRNRNIIIFAICLLFVCIGNVTSQINVPNPSIYLAFDTNDPSYESVSKKSGFLSGTSSRWADRFGNADRAVKFEGKGAGVRLSGYNINAVHTVSLWVYIGDPSEIPAGAIPFSPTDTESEFYNWTDTQNRILKGIGRKKATVGFNRYIPKPDGTIVPWYLWSYKPAQFDKLGWYHIFVVHGMYYTRLIMYKPDSTKAYSYIWMGDQGFPTNKYLYIGGYPGHESNTYFDDFKVYNAELTDDQIEFQHVAEYPKETYVKIQNQNSGKYAVVENAAFGNLSLIIQHSTGVGNDEWKLIFTGLNECKIKNLHSSRFMVVKDASTEVGAEVIQYDERGTDNEVWILDYSTLDSNYFRLKNKKSGKYLSVFQNSKLDNYKLIQANGTESSVYWTFLKSVPNARTMVDPGLYRVKNKKSGLYMTVQNRSYDIATSFAQDTRTGSDDDVDFDTWYVEPAASGRDAYTFMSPISKYYMTGYFYDPEGSDILQGVDRKFGESDWQLISTGIPNEYRMKNMMTYYYAVVKDASTAKGAHVVQYRSGTGDNEIWTLERVFYSDSPLSKGIYKLRNENSFKLMVVKDALKTDNAQIIQYSTGEGNSEWEILPATFGFVQLRNKNSQKYLVVQNASTAIGEILIQHGTGTPNSYWKINREVYTESGAKHVAYTLTNQYSKLYAVVKDASTADGIPVIQYNTGEKNKLWTFEAQSLNASTRAFDPGQAEIATDLNKPEVMVDCKNDIILLDYPFETSTELVVRIMDLAGRQIYEGKRQVDKGSNVITISQFNSALNANQFYIISIRSTDGKVNCSVKAIMSK
mgnify:CR=1 FL=1